jgi:hypothetical protein
MSIERKITEILLIGLRARREKASNFVLNSDMHIECDLLDAEIEALEKTLKKTRTALK